MTAVGEAALAYAAAGYAVFPLRGKQPLGNCPACESRSPHYRPHQATECGHELCHGLYAASSDVGRVGRWWGRWPQANIGARVPANLLVVDVDPRHGGLGQLAELEREHGPLPPTRVSISGRGDGGQHRWFLHPGGRLSAARLGAGVDLKTHAGYVLLPPSRHPATGQPYTWAEPTLEPAVLPAAWRRLLTPAPARVPATRRPSLPGPTRGGRMAEAFNQATSWTQVLGPHGWTCPDPDPDAEGARWRHPGATNPKSATIRHGLLFVYSQATPFQPTEAGTPRGYSRFRAYAVLEHGGDLRAAARTLRDATR
jgi:Bifunctional DNA primase/polymerase, N-terminal